MKIASIVGARPNFIKMAPVIREIEKRGLEHIFIHTGQHYDRELSDVFFEELKLPKLDYHLDVGSGTHGEQTGRMLIAIEKVLVKEKPDVVLVPGDTNTALAGALATVKLQIPVGHVEAGLRYNKYYIYNRSSLEPEQINRSIVDHVSDFLFCPNKICVNNLIKEGIPQERIFLTTDTMVDAFIQNSAIAMSSSQEILKKLSLKKGEYFVITLHRPLNVDNSNVLKEILSAFSVFSYVSVFPVHPRTKKTLQKIQNYEKIYDNILFCEPVGYMDFLNLINNAKLVITDSGGVQKEAFMAKVPCITLKNETEWVETVDLGCNILAGWRPSHEKLRTLIEIAMNLNFDNVENPYGDGKASERIVNVLIEKLGGI